VIVAEDTVMADSGMADGGMADGGMAEGVDGRPGGVVGGVVVRAEPATPCGFLLERLYVDPSRWGSGIGGMLHDAAVRAARQRGVCGVNLWVLVQNHRARAMYERRGWHLVAGEQLAHTSPPITEVRYELELPAEELPDDVDLPDELDRADDVVPLENEEGPARASRSFVPRETMLGGTCSTSTTLSVGERALSDHRAIRPIRRLAAATRPARRIG
ncbi:MAG TPA: GNAT family N-acetyltransferase, partial [Ilumatobacteraceae bacterium]